MELAQEYPEEDIVFLTSDKGFLGAGGLHAHLIEDLSLAQLDGSVSHLGSLPALVTVLQGESESSGWSNWRELRITELCYEKVAALDANDFAEYWDARDGGMQPP